MVLEVADVWFDILLTWSVFRCGFEHRPHKCSCLYRVLFIWEGAAARAPSAHGWVSTSVRRAFKHGRLCIGCKNLCRAFWISSHHVNCNPGHAGLRRKGYKLLVPWPCLASLPGGPRTCWMCNGSSFQPPHPSSFRDSHAAVASQPCTLRAPSHHNMTTTGLSRLVHGLGGEAGAGEGLFW